MGNNIGYIKFDTTKHAQDFINQIDDCLGFPNGGTLTWDEVTSICTLDISTSGYTDFWGYVVKVNTDELNSCLTQQQKDNIIQLPDNCQRCQ